MVYTVREFRKRLKEALDLADKGKAVVICRNKKVYLIEEIKADDKG